MQRVCRQHRLADCRESAVSACQSRRLTLADTGVYCRSKLSEVCRVNAHVVFCRRNIIRVIDYGIHAVQSGECYQYSPLKLVVMR
jgi:hypothetical protein